MLATTIEHLSSLPRKSKRSYEILIVDDGSSDDTSALSLKLAKKYSKSDIRVVTLEKNLGKGGAVRHGMLHGRGERLLMVDADGASRFEDLEMLWEAMDKLAPSNEPAVVVGSRAHLVKTEAVVKVSSVQFNGVPELIQCHLLAFIPAQCSHVRLTHHPPDSRCWPYPRHAVRIQTLHPESRAADISVAASYNMDIRCRAPAPGQAAEHPCGRSACGMA